MQRGLSVYLDLLRIMAAFAVLVGHAQGYLLPVIPAAIASHSEEGVAIFFVLSGFVIRYVSLEKEPGWRPYAFARFTRLFSVIPIALAATFIADMVGRAIDPAYYAGIAWYGADYGPALLRSLTFTNELWGDDIVFGSNHAYWSLGFEVQYYLVFALMFYLPRRIAPFAVAIWALFVGPVVALYLTLWLAGLVAFELVRRGAVRSRLVGLLLAGASLLLYVAVKFGLRDYKVPMTEWPDAPALLASYGYFMLVGLAVVMNILGVARLLDGVDVFGAGLTKAIRWVAGGTFTLYLVHQPLLTLGRAVLPDYAERVGLAAGFVVLTVIVCYVLAELGERRKHLYKQAFLGVGRTIGLSPRPSAGQPAA